VPQPELQRIFISYAHGDEEDAPETYKQVFKALRNLQNSGELEIWTDRQIETGDDWFAKIKVALDDCVTGILLIGPDFLNSDFINKAELPALFERADEQNTPIFPVQVLYTGDVAPWMKKLQKFAHQEALEEHEGAALRKRLKELVEEIHKRLTNPPQRKPNSGKKINLKKLPGWNHD